MSQPKSSENSFTRSSVSVRMTAKSSRKEVTPNGNSEESTWVRPDRTKVERHDGCRRTEGEGDVAEKLRAGRGRVPHDRDRN